MIKWMDISARVLRQDIPGTTVKQVKYHVNSYSDYLHDQVLVFTCHAETS